MGVDVLGFESDKVVRIAHVSDVHFGRIAGPSIVSALVEDVNRSEVDLVVASGDLTQRAFPHQYRAARAMLDSFSAPVLALAGNHDVFPWWRTRSRLLDPLRRFRNWISEEEAPRFTTDRLAVFGINSATGRSVKNGVVGEDEAGAIRGYFPSAPSEALRVLAVHHPLVQFIGLEEHDVARGGSEVLVCAAENGVDLVLCGHLHISHVERVLPADGLKPIVIASAGTATSDRSRHPQKNRNLYNQITVGSTEFSISEKEYSAERKGFFEFRKATFPRAG